jgi:hypothetical protein
VDLRVQDSVFTKRNMSSSSVIGMEASTRVLMERVKLHAPWTRRNNEGWALWGTAATDSATDLKGTAFLGAMWRFAEAMRASGWGIPPAWTEH